MNSRPTLLVVTVKIEFGLGNIDETFLEKFPLDIYLDLYLKTVQIMEERIQKMKICFESNLIGQFFNLDLSELIYEFTYGYENLRKAALKITMNK